MAKRLTLAELLGNIGIAAMGEGNAALLIHDYALTDVTGLMGLSPHQIEVAGKSQGKTIGESQGGQIYEGLRIPRVQAILKNAHAWLVDPEQKALATQQAQAALKATDLSIDLKGKKVCFTGTAPISRKDLTALLEAHGASVQSAVNKDTEILFITDPDSNSSKAVTARKNGTQILAYSELGI